MRLTTRSFLRLITCSHTEYIGLEALKGLIREFIFPPVIPFKADCLALVEDRGPDLAAMIIHSISRPLWGLHITVGAGQFLLSG